MSTREGSLPGPGRARCYAGHRPARRAQLPMRRTSEIEEPRGGARTAARRAPESPESRERGNASAGEGRIGCAMTRATRIAAAHAAGGRVRSTETATVPHAGTTLPVLFPRSPMSRSLASSEGSSPHEPGQSGLGRQRRDHQRRPTSFGRRATNHRIFRRRRRSRGADIGWRGNPARYRRPQASPQSRRSRPQPERFRHGRQLRRERGRHQDPRRPRERRPGTCRHDGRWWHFGSSSSARTRASHDPEHRRDPRDGHDLQDRLDPQDGFDHQELDPPGSSDDDH
jgi:hypothetical protein